MLQDLPDSLCQAEQCGRCSSQRAGQQCTLSAATYHILCLTTFPNAAPQLLKNISAASILFMPTFHAIDTRNAWLQKNIPCTHDLQHVKQLLGHRYGRW